MLLELLGLVGKMDGVGSAFTAGTLQVRGPSTSTMRLYVHLSHRTAEMLERGMTPAKEAEMAGFIKQLSEQSSHIKFLQQELMVTRTSLSCASCVLSCLS